jgi:NADH:ubiquinone oxidoreductase subunit E
MNIEFKKTLFKWTEEPKDNIDIDWPNVHKAVGSDQIKWLEEQPLSTCQMVLEMVGNEVKLVAEFYNKTTANTYMLLWA